MGELESFNSACDKHISVPHLRMLLNQWT